MFVPENHTWVSPRILKLDQLHSVVPFVTIMNENVFSRVHVPIAVMHSLSLTSVFMII